MGLKTHWKFIRAHLSLGSLLDWGGCACLGKCPAGFVFLLLCWEKFLMHLQFVSYAFTGFKGTEGGGRKAGGKDSGKGRLVGLPRGPNNEMQQC